MRTAAEKNATLFLAQNELNYIKTRVIFIGIILKVIAVNSSR